MKDNDYSATKIMGWIRRGRDYLISEEPLDFAPCAYEDVPYSNDNEWSPGTNRDHLFLILEKVDGEPWFDALETGGIDRQVDRESTENFAFWPTCIYDPALALEAICGAHREAR